MSNRIDITGDTFGKLTIEKYIGTSGKSSNWLANCECGNSVFITRRKLKKGKKSRGCLQSKPKFVNLFNKVKKLNSLNRKRFVYVARRSIDGAVKIGMTSNVYERMKSLSIEFGSNFNLLFYVELEGANYLESGLHQKYAPYQFNIKRLNGTTSREFFHLNVKCIQYDLIELGLEILYD